MPAVGLGRVNHDVPFKFTGKIGKVTIDLQKMVTATAIGHEKPQREAALAKGLQD